MTDEIEKLAKEIVDELMEEFKGNMENVLDPRLKKDGQGKIRTFDTGATRDSVADKIEYRRHFSARVLRRYGEYMHKHRVQSDGSLREPDNWKKGIPIGSYMDSLYRHTQDLAYGFETLEYSEDEGEELLCAIIFNASGMLHELLLQRTKYIIKET